VNEIPLKAEHLEEIAWLVAEFQQYEPLAKEAQGKYETARRMVEILTSAQQRMYKLNLALDDNALIRNIEMTAYFLSEARRQDELLALYRNILASLREALTLFLADEYELDATRKSWTLDVDEKVLRYEEDAHHGALPQ
jgi:hypothetical protein